MIWKLLWAHTPFPTSYYDTHTAMGTWKSETWQELISPVLMDEEMRQAYN